MLTCMPVYIVRCRNTSVQTKQHAHLPACPAVYVVFGSTGGIGSALCKRLSKQAGASVVLVGRDVAKLEALQAELAPGCNSMALTADVVDSKQAGALEVHVSVPHAPRV